MGDGSGRLFDSRFSVNPVEAVRARGFYSSEDFVSSFGKESFRSIVKRFRGGDEGFWPTEMSRNVERPAPSCDRCSAAGTGYAYFEARSGAVLE